MVNKITETFETKLQAHIQAVEAVSPIEIVPVLLKRASDYSTWAIVYGLTFAFIPAQILFYRFLPVWSSYVIIVDLLIWLVLGLLLGNLLKRFKFFSYFVPKSAQQLSAQQRAESLFLHEGLVETKQRLGLLIAVFEFEKCVLVLADKGFNAHIASSYWSELGKTLAKDFSAQKPGDEFLEALEKIQKDIAPHFKVEGNNPNELSDELRKK